MSEINERCLEVFPTWLQALGNDVQILMRALQSNELGNDARRFLTGGINYLFKTLDLIPDGIDDIGYLDDAFMIRMTARAAMDSDIGPIEPELIGKLGRLAGETELLSDFFSPDIYERLDNYARDSRNGAARGRMVDEIVERSDVYNAFIGEVQDFIRDYQAPQFVPDEKNLIKLNAFFEAKLPQ